MFSLQTLSSNKIENRASLVYSNLMNSALKNTMLASILLGSGSVAGNNASAHPLELSEKTYDKRAEQLDYAMLRKTQGVHAPLKLQMEKRVLGKTGHLPFLPRSNASLEAITGRDEQIGFEDFLGSKNFPERMGQPHAMVEKYCKY